MKTETLKTIQTLSNLGRILSKIAFVLSVVAFCLCFAGILSLAFFPESIKVGGVTIQGLVQASDTLTEGTLYATMAASAVMLAGEAVLAKLAEKYFRNELADGTPFTFGGAKELLRLGICAIAIPIGTSVVAHIVFSVLENILENVGDWDITDPVSVGLGVMMIVTSLICKYGAELAQDKDPA